MLLKSGKLEGLSFEYVAGIAQVQIISWMAKIRPWTALCELLIEWHVKSTTKASQGLYEYDAVTRLRDSQLGDERVKDIKNYIKKGKLWEAFESDYLRATGW